MSASLEIRREDSNVAALPGKTDDDIHPIDADGMRAME